MRKRLSGIFAARRRSASGFTLTEVLVVVAIIGILALLAIPRFGAVKAELHQVEMDQTAKEMYVAAQNNLTRLQSSGGLKTLRGVSTTPNTDGVALIPGKPSDYTGVKSWEDVSADYCYLSSGSTAAALLLPLGSIDDTARLGGFYYIEYDLASCTVYSVFYSDKEFGYLDTAFNATRYRTDRGERKDAGLGYYGGGGVDRDSIKKCPDPILSVENGNELKLGISWLDPDNAGNTGFAPRVWLSDGVTQVEVPAASIVDNLNNSYTVVLDSLTQPAKGFADQFPTLVPGADLKITVSFEKTATQQAYWLSSFATASVNSLFASRTGAVVSVSCARHLQNLDSAFSGVNSGVTPEITSAVQVADIDLSGVAFSSIDNAALLSYDGGSLKIKNLVSADGLFGSFNSAGAPNAELKNVYLENPRIAGAATSGALAASAVNTAVSGCRVYAFSLSNGSVNYADLVGANYSVRASSVAGGLIGSVSGGSVTNCFAALPMTSSPDGGGLIGSASNCAVSYCYSAADDFTGASMLIGTADAATSVNNCYAIGNCASAADALTFAGNAAVTSSYCAFSYYTDGITGSSSTVATSYLGFDGSGVKTDYSQSADPLSGFTSGTWGQATNYKTHPYQEALNGRAYPYKAIQNLPHYGSWPLDGGGVNVTVTMSITGDTLTDPFSVCRMVLDLHNTTILDTNAADNNRTVEVTPRATLGYIAAPVDGYTVTSVRVGTLNSGGSNTSGEAVTGSFQVNRDTVIHVTLYHSSYDLTANAVSPDAYAAGRGYTVTSGATSISPTASAPASTALVAGSTVFITPVGSSSSDYAIANVYYYVGNSTTPVSISRDVNGLYSFTMPEEDISVHMDFSNKNAAFVVQYYVMGLNGNYSSQTASKTLHFAYGTAIDAELLEYLATTSEYYVKGGVEWDETQSQIVSVKRVVTTYNVGSVTRNAYSTTNNLSMPCDTSYDDSPYNGYPATREYTYTFKVYLKRLAYDLTVLPGNNITEVRIDNNKSSSAQGLTRSILYGKDVTIKATTAWVWSLPPGYVPFVAWTEANDSFPSSADISYKFKMPAQDLSFTGYAEDSESLVHISVYKDDSAWLHHGRNVALRNVSSQAVVTLANTTGSTDAYLSSGVVTHGTYNILVDGEVVTDSTGGAIAPVQLVVNDFTEYTVYLYSVDYDRGKKDVVGRLPENGVYLKYETITVPGNVGLLKVSDPDDPAKVFAGWNDAIAYDGKNYVAGDTFTLTKPTDLFARWVDSLSVMYEPNRADGGELPSDPTAYQNGQTVNVIFPAAQGGLYKNGYKFTGWTTHDVPGTALFTPANGPFSFAMPSGVPSVTLTAQWELTTYAVTFHNASGQTITGSPYSDYGAKHYGDTITAPGFTAAVGYTFIGWAGSLNGDAAYRQGDSIKVTGDMGLYAVVVKADLAKTVTFSSFDERTTFGAYPAVRNTGVYLPGSIGGSGAVLAWSTQPNGAGTIYYIDSATGVSSVAFPVTDDATLYAVTGKVYSVLGGSWHDTLGDAVSHASTGDTLIFYGDTQETGEIKIGSTGKHLDLTLLSAGSHTVQWTGSAFSGGNSVSGSDNYASDCFGCLTVENSTLTLGNTQGVGSLTFDANGKCRVVSLRNGATLNMHDGVTLANGLLSGGRSSGNLDYQYYGGGIFCAKGSSFNMYGGAISDCSAYSGGGVYLVQGSAMQMGDMIQAAEYSPTAIYYTLSADASGAFYEVVENVDETNYSDYFITHGDPVIIRNSSLRPATASGTSFYDDGGGGIFTKDLLKDTLILYRGTLTQNSANANGGGILTDGHVSSDRLRIYEVEISHNSANCGGGVYQWHGTLFIYNSDILQNSAVKAGGGICLVTDNVDSVGAGYPSSIEFWYGSIRDNVAGTTGGGVQLNYGCSGYSGRTRLLMKGGELTGNTATGDGDGVFVGSNNSAATACMFELSGGAIYGNGTDDVYLSQGAAVTVSSGGFDRSLMELLGEKLSLIAAADAADTVVTRYADTGDFDVSDANFIHNAGSSATATPPLLVIPDETAKTLKLGADDGKRTLVFQPNGENVYVSGDPATPAQTRTDSDVPGGTKYTATGAVAGERAFPAWSRDYYRFSGWGAASDAAVGVSEYTVSADYGQMLYALWTQNKLHYDLTTRPGSFTLPDGVGKVTSLPTVPEYIGVGTGAEQYVGTKYTFDGWANTSGGEKAYDAGAEYDELKSAAEDKTLYARWTVQYDTEHTYTLKLHPNSPGVTDSSTDIRITCDSVNYPQIQYLLSDSTFSLVGHTLVKWTTAPDGSDGYDIGHQMLADDFDPATKELDLYAKWEPIKYTLTFNLREGEATTRSDVTFPHTSAPYDYNYIIQDGDLYTADDFASRSHKVFAGWTDSVNGVNIALRTGSPVLSDMELYILWQNDSHTITFDCNGGSLLGTSPVSVTHGEQTPVTGAYRFGYELTGWSDTPDGSGGVKSTYTVEDDMTLTAQWNLMRYAVGFNLNYEAAPAPEVHTAYTVATDEATQEQTAVSLPVTPKREGYEFDGWYTAAIGGDKLAGPLYYVDLCNHFNVPDTAPVYGFTLYAHWRYSVSFLPGEHGEGDMAPITGVGYDEVIQTPLSEFTPVGNYAFDSWQDQNGNVYFLDDPDLGITVTDNLVLTAQWAQVFTLSFDPEPADSAPMTFALLPGGDDTEALSGEAEAHGSPAPSLVTFDPIPGDDGEDVLFNDNGLWLAELPEGTEIVLPAAFRDVDGDGLADYEVTAWYYSVIVEAENEEDEDEVLDVFLYPGDTFIVTEDLFLTAQWSPII